MSPALSVTQSELHAPLLSAKYHTPFAPPQACIERQGVRLLKRLSASAEDTRRSRPRVKGLARLEGMVRGGGQQEGAVKGGTQQKERAWMRWAWAVRWNSTPSCACQRVRGTKQMPDVPTRNMVEWTRSMTRSLLHSPAPPPLTRAQSPTHHGQVHDHEQRIASFASPMGDAQQRAAEALAATSAARRQQVQQQQQAFEALAAERHQKQRAEAGAKAGWRVGGEGVAQQQQHTPADPEAGQIQVQEEEQQPSSEGERLSQDQRGSAGADPEQQIRRGSDGGSAQTRQRSEWERAQIQRLMQEREKELQPPPAQQQQPPVQQEGGATWEKELQLPLAQQQKGGASRSPPPPSSGCSNTNLTTVVSSPAAAVALIIGDSDGTDDWAQTPPGPPGGEPQHTTPEPTVAEPAGLAPPLHTDAAAVPEVWTGASDAPTPLTQPTLPSFLTPSSFDNTPLQSMGYADFQPQQQQQQQDTMQSHFMLQQQQQQQDYMQAQMLLQQQQQQQDSMQAQLMLMQQQTTLQQPFQQQTQQTQSYQQMLQMQQQLSQLQAQMTQLSMLPPASSSQHQLLPARQPPGPALQQQLVSAMSEQQPALMQQVRHALLPPAALPPRA